MKEADEYRLACEAHITAQQEAQRAHDECMAAENRMFAATAVMNKAKMKLLRAARKVEA